MFTELIEPKKKERYTAVYKNEDKQNVYLSENGSVLPNSKALWPEGYNLDKGE